MPSLFFIKNISVKSNLLKFGFISIEKVPNSIILAERD